MFLTYWLRSMVLVSKSLDLWSLQPAQRLSLTRVFVSVANESYHRLQQSTFVTFCLYGYDEVLIRLVLAGPILIFILVYLPLEIFLISYLFFYHIYSFIHSFLNSHLVHSFSLKWMLTFAYTWFDIYLFDLNELLFLISLIEVKRQYDTIFLYWNFCSKPNTQ